MFKAFGSAPTTINFNEIYTALQSKVVDGRRTRSRSSKLRSSTKCRLLLDDEPHVGRLLVPRQPPQLGGAAGGHPRFRSPRTSTPPASPSAPTSPSSAANLRERALRQGHEVQRRRRRALPREAASRGLLHGVEQQIRRQAWSTLGLVGKLESTLPLQAARLGHGRPRSRRPAEAASSMAWLSTTRTSVMDMADMDLA